MSNPSNLESGAGPAIVLYLLCSVFFILCLTFNVAPASGEGSRSDPVLLGVDSPHQASVGGVDFVYSSYYCFKTNAAGGYAIRLTNAHSNLVFTVFSDHYYTMVDTKGYDSISPTPNNDKTCVCNLAANTYYYVSVMDSDFVADNFTITVNDVKSEGSPGAPVPIAEGTSHGGMVDAGSSSYYSFTPASSSSYTFAITNPYYFGSQDSSEYPLQIDTYAGADFSTGLMRSCTPYYGAIYCTVNGLTQGVPAYIKISEKSFSPSDTMFTVTPGKGIGEGSVAHPVALAVGSPHSGGVDAGSNQFYQGCQNPSYSYYTFNTAAGAGGYTVTTDNALGVQQELFHSFSEAPLASCVSFQDRPCMYSNINPDSNYYLRVTNCNDSIVSYNLLVKKEGSEGSVSNPVHLTLETTHAGTIGYYETSYFTFTTDRSGTYNLIFDQNMSWSYASSPDFASVSVTSCDASLASCDGTAVYRHPNLDANKTYYLRVYNLGGLDIKHYTVKVVHGASEGSIANPVSLPAGTKYGGTVEAYGRSYYTFTTRAAADYSVKFDNPTDLWVFAYTDPGFINGSITTACSGPGPYVSCTLRNLAANTPYYIMTEERANVNAAFNININVLDYLAGCSAGSECYNFENGDTAPFTLTSTVSKGNVSRSLWGIDTTNNAANGGTKSLKSGTLAYDQTNPQSTCFQYTRPATANTVLFSLKVDAPSTNTIEFFIDDAVQPGGTFNNTPLWRRVIFFPSPGRHTYKWCFNENDRYVTTPYSAWVDDIEFTVDAQVQVSGLGSPFATIQDAYSAAVANSMTNPVLNAQAVTFDGPFNFDSPLDVTFKGGLDPTFTSVTGYSYLNGTLTLMSGSLTAENVVIR